MHIQHTPDTFEKLTQMGDVTLYEPAGDAPNQEQSRRRKADFVLECVAEVQTPKGPKPVMKTMMTTACERNCFYCPFRAGRSSTPRVTVSPDDMAKAFNTLREAKRVDGLFLSSGIIKGGATAQDKILDTVDIIRKKYAYRGYIHLKIMPGAEYDQLYRAMQLADRISINLEGATAERLSALAPKKDFYGELVKQLHDAHQIKQNDPRIRASIVTQFVVGAVGDTDVELLSLSERLYNQLGLARAYYSPFHPITDTPFEHLTPTAEIRKNRLYQASFLLRDYGWDVEDLPFIDGGFLRTDVDPKVAWADENLRHQPIDLMKADRAQLMRVPGIGVKGAEAILKARTQQTIHDIQDLARLHIRAPHKMAPYVLLNGRKPSMQLPLF